MTWKRGYVVCCFAALTAGCAIVDNLDDDGILEGYFSFGFEDASFFPCHVNEAWWVNSDPAVGLLDAYSAIASGPHDLVYGRARGTRTPRGTYGHLGRYQREFTVMDLVEIRSTKAGDCVPPALVQTG